ncbi:MAG: DNA polymerase III subunit delta [Patescibacteria group bacterium]
MIHFIFGADTYRVKARLTSLKEEFLTTASDFNFHHQLADELTLADLPQLFQGATLLGGNRLVILEDIFSASSEIKEALAMRFKAGLPEDLTVVVASHADFDKRQSLYKWLSKSAQVEMFELLAGQPLLDYVTKLTTQHQLTLAPIQLRQLIDLAGNDLWQLDNELAKLAAYSRSHPITDVVISELVARDPQDDIFAIMAALADHQLARANHLVADLIQRGEDPIGILAVLTFQVRTLLRVSTLAQQRKSSAVIVQITGLHPYAVTRSLEQSRQFSFSRLASIYQLLVKLDWKIKQGDLASDDALDWLVATLAGVAT